MHALEKIATLSQALWQEPSSEYLLRHYLRLLNESFGVSDPLLLSMNQVDGHFSLSLNPSPEAARAWLGAHDLEALEQQVHLLCATQVDGLEGVSTLVLSLGCIEFAILGEPGSEGWLVIWRSTHTDMEESSQILDFLTRQVQHSLRWLTRLDKTKALLYQDDLTGLFNYRYLDIALDAEIRRVGRFSSCFCLLFIDLDNFKPINDVHGHLAGSQVLRQVASVLREGLREVDSVFRYGGDEYVVLLIEANSQMGLLAAERMRRRLEATEFSVDGGATVRLTASIGVASAPDHGMDKETLIRIADTHMYRAKHSGKNRVAMAVRDGDAYQPVSAATLRKST